MTEWTTPEKRKIAVGRRHRALRDLEVIVLDYDSLIGERALLGAGELFQPWEPLEHWRGEKIPITLGGEHSRFDWGVTSAEGHFLRWDDFFLHCELAGDGSISDP